MRTLFRLLPAVALVASACASASAKAPAERPGLEVPPPPPRVIEAAPELPIPEPVGDLPVAPPPPPARPGRGSRETPARPAATEAKPPDPKPVEQPPTEPAAPAPPAAQLRTPQTSDTTGAARTVRTTIDNARGFLNAVNFGPLSNERKKAYNDVKLFLQQAEDALKQGNLAFAQGVADKAEKLAKDLAGR